VDHWFEIINHEDVPSPSLLVYPQRIQSNIDSMLLMAPAARLRPHVKTHKMQEVVALCRNSGIEKFKTATIAESEMCARAGAGDILLAFQPVGPNINRLKILVEAFPQTRFSTILDNDFSSHELSCFFAHSPIDVWVDVDCGMHRTGIAPKFVPDFFARLETLPGLRVRGLHAYDGHIHAQDLAVREKEHREAMTPVLEIRSQLRSKDRTIEIVAGGTPTFPFNALLPGTECAPGTPLLWDAGYSQQYPDLPFQLAATLLCRVISNPTPNHYCLDLGHKAVASESPQPRLWLPQIPDAELVGHSEEHLVIRTALNLKIGTALYAFPKHICPTCALYDEAVAVFNNLASTRWKIHRGRALKE
jgi:D-serine deaminase-like pyridoxal phosphate-dependent protein